MKNSDIETLAKVASALEIYLPVMEYELYTEYISVYEQLKAKNAKEKQSYQDNAEYYRETSRKWRKDNRDRHYEYQRKYRQKQNELQKSGNAAPK